MEGLSLVGDLLDKIGGELEAAAALQPAEPWGKTERTPQARAKRVAKSDRNFPFFDRTYWLPEQYRQGYAKPGKFQKEVAEAFDSPGTTIILGARIHAKTATAKKKFIHELLTGRRKFAGTFSEGLLTSANILKDIRNMIHDNPRIVSDYGVEFIEDNDEQITFHVRQPGRKQFTCHVRVYGEGRSVRGASAIFDRPEMMLGDDIETRTSSMTEEGIAKRAKIVAEAVGSMAKPNFVFIILGNNFAEPSLMNTYATQFELGLLPASWRVIVRPAWHNGAPLWPERYPATSEAHLREMLQPADDAEWDGDFMQRPRKSDGIHFKRIYYREWIALPDDARGIIYTDPNISLKGLGDTTAVVALLFSPSWMKYFIYWALCKSYSDPLKLLDDVMKKRDRRIRGVGWDGHVTQGAVWTNFIKSWCRERGKPIPAIEFLTYKVDELAKNTQLLYNAGDLLFPPGFALSEEGTRFLDQFFAFSGKKSGKTDDAPDATICAVEFINERGLARPRQSGRPQPVIPVSDFYDFD